MSDVTDTTKPTSVELDTLPVDGSIGLFGADPQAARERMIELSKLLIEVVDDRKLWVKIGGRKHLLVEAWGFLGAMVGIVPTIAWTKELEDGYQDYALCSMAQTRAISRALRGPLGQILVLAGYEPAAPEELPHDPQANPTGPAAEDPPTKEQIERVSQLIELLAQAAPETDWPQRCREIAGRPTIELTYKHMNLVLEQLDRMAAELDNSEQGSPDGRNPPPLTADDQGVGRDARSSIDADFAFSVGEEDH
jgi:hypothetical protein